MYPPLLTVHETARHSFLRFLTHTMGDREFNVTLKTKSRSRELFAQMRGEQGDSRSEASSSNSDSNSTDESQSTRELLLSAVDVSTALRKHLPLPLPLLLPPPPLRSRALIPILTMWVLPPWLP